MAGKAWWYCRMVIRATAPRAKWGLKVLQPVDGGEGPVHGDGRSKLLAWCSWVMIRLRINDSEPDTGHWRGILGQESSHLSWRHANNLRTTMKGDREPCNPPSGVLEWSLRS